MNEQLTALTLQLGPVPVTEVLQGRDYNWLVAFTADRKMIWIHREQLNWLQAAGIVVENINDLCTSDFYLWCTREYPEELGILDNFVAVYNDFENLSRCVTTEIIEKYLNSLEDQSQST